MRRVAVVFLVGGMSLLGTSKIVVP